MSFKVNDKVISTKITLGKARKLAEDGIADLLDSEGIVKLNDIFASPLKKLDFLYEVVKDQVGDRDDYEKDLDITEAFESLEADIANFTQAVGTFEHWSSLQKHSKRVNQKQCEILESVLEDPKVMKMLDDMKDSALDKLGTGLKEYQEKSE